MTLNQKEFFNNYTQNSILTFFHQTASFFHRNTDSVIKENQKDTETFLTYNLDYTNDIIQSEVNVTESVIFSNNETLHDSRKLLGFTVTTLSKILQVTRPTVYSYLEGKTPSDKVVQNKIQKIHDVLTLLSCQLGPKNNYFTLTKKFDSQGKNLIDYLSANKEITDFINILCKSELDKPKIIIKHRQKTMSNAFYSVPASLNED